MVKLALAEFDYHKLMKKQRFESVKRCKRIYKNNKFTAVAQRFANKFRVQRPALPLHRYKVWKLLIHRRLKSQATQMQNIFQTPLALCRLAKKFCKWANKCEMRIRNENEKLFQYIYRQAKDQGFIILYFNTADSQQCAMCSECNFKRKTWPSIIIYSFQPEREPKRNMTMWWVWSFWHRKHCKRIISLIFNGHCIHSYNHYIDYTFDGRTWFCKSHQNSKIVWSKVKLSPVRLSHI